MTDLPDVKLKALLSFPATIVDGTGIDVTKTHGKYRIDLAFDDFAPPVSGVSDPSHQNTLLWNDNTNAYTLAPISILGSAGTVPEAPVNGIQYGRKDAAWTPIGSDFINVKNYGAVGDGVAIDTTAIQAAIDAAHATNGGKILIPAGNYLISSTLTITKGGVFIYGAGEGPKINATDTANNPIGAGTGSTKLIWTGAAGGTMMTFLPPNVPTAQTQSGGGVSGIGFISDTTYGLGNSAAYGVKVGGWRYGTFAHLTFTEFTTAGLWLGYTTNTMAANEDHSSQFLDIYSIYGSMFTRTGAIIYMAGNATTNSSLTTLRDIDGSHFNGDGIVFDGADNNRIFGARMFRNATGTGVSLRFKSRSDYTSNHNQVYHWSSNGPTVMEGTETGATIATYGNQVIEIDDGNNTPHPTLGTGADGFWSGSVGQKFRHQNVGLSAGEATWSATKARDTSAAVGYASCYLVNGSSAHLVLGNADLSSVWRIAVNPGAAGDMFIGQLSGSGNLIFANVALIGNPTAPTPSPGDNDTSIATTAFVTTAVSTKAPLATISPSLPSGGVDGDVWYQVLGGGGTGFPFSDTVAPGALAIGGLTVTPVYAPLGVVSDTTVTAPNGMSWTFPGAVTHGTYVNGDVWVYTTTTLPMPTMSSAPNGTGEGAQNGGMVNPTFNTLVEQHPLCRSPYVTAMKQGYDGRVYESGSYLYDATYNAHTNGSVLHPGDSLVSCESMYPTVRTRDDLWAFQSSNRTAIGRMACLTVVNYTPFTDEFRPAYFGTTKTRRRWSDMNLTLLPNLTAPFNPKGAGSSDFHLDVASTYPGGDPYPYMTNAHAVRANSLADMQYWIAPIYGNSPISMLCPVQQQWWYRREQNTAYGQLACYVLHNFSDRDPFLANIIQAGIDAYETAIGFTGLTPFSCGAGFYATPLWFVRFAGLLFNEAGMKAAAIIATTKVDFYGNVWPKWGEQTRVYYSATAHAQYRLPSGYSGLTPLYGDMPDADYSTSVGENTSMRDPNGVFDAYAFAQHFILRYGTVAANSADGTTLQLDIASDPPTIPGNSFYNGDPIVGILDGVERPWTTITAYNGTTRVCTVSPAFPIAPDSDDKFNIYMSTFPTILNVTYTQWWPGVSYTLYGQENYAHMGMFLASQTMGDSGFWGGAIADFDKRWANDRQWWQGWGQYFDYSSTDSTYLFYRDARGLGGSGNGWMSYLWDRINPFSPGSLPITGATILPVYHAHAMTETITASSLPISGQTITPVYLPSGSVVIFTQTLTADDGPWPGYSLRTGVTITGGAGATNQIRVTFEASSTGSLALDHASIGISTDATFNTGFEDCTAAPVELTFGGGGHGFASIAAGQTKVSDWVTLGGFTSSSALLVTLDFGASNNSVRIKSALGAAANCAFSSAAAWYNQQNVTPAGSLSGQVQGFNKIEVK